MTRNTRNEMRTRAQQTNNRTPYMKIECTH